MDASARTRTETELTNITNAEDADRTENYPTVAKDRQMTTETIL